MDMRKPTRGIYNREVHDEHADVIKDVVKEEYHGIKDGYAARRDAVINDAKAGYKDIKGQAREQYQDIKESVKAEYDATLDAIKKGYKDVKQAATDQYGEVKKAVANQYDRKIDAAETLKDATPIDSVIDPYGKLDPLP